MNRLEAIEARSKWLLDTHVADLAVGGISIGTGKLLTALKATVAEDIPALLAVVRAVEGRLEYDWTCPVCQREFDDAVWRNKPPMMHADDCPLAALLREEEVPE